MIEITVKGEQAVAAMLAAVPGKATRACAIALNQTAMAIRTEAAATMRKVFDRPVPYTLRSAVFDRATYTDLTARVWHAEPERMSQHYLTPQVEGGERRLKGFERALGLGELVPAMGAKMDRYGNVSVGQIRQILSVLGKAERGAGYSANITDRSRRRNTKARDYVIIDRRQRGRLVRGVYQRFAQPGREIDKKTSRRLGITGDRAREYGRSKGQWQSVRQATGLRPVLLVGRTGHQVKPLYDFYGMALQVYRATFAARFWANIDRFLKS